MLLYNIGYELFKNIHNLSNTLQVVIITFGFCFLIYLIQSLWFKFVTSSVYNYKVTKGPFSLPFIGNAFHLFINNSKRLEYFQQLQIKFGDVYNLDILGSYGIFICDPADVKHVLTTNFENYEKGKIFCEPFRELFSEGIFVVDGKQWQACRKCMSHMFTTRLLKGFVSEVFNKHLESLCYLIETKNKMPEKFYDIQQILSCFTLDSICEIAFGSNINSLQSGQSEFGEAFDYVTATCNFRIINPLWKLCRFLQLPYEREFTRCMNVLDNFTHNLIKNCRKNTEEKINLKFDILSTAAQTLDDNEKLYSDKFIRDMVLSFVIAGRDTTANALSWTLYLIAAHPQVQEKLRQEINDNLKESYPEFSVVNSLLYTQWVVNESLRLYPPVHSDIKFAIKDDVLPSGHYVPKGSAICYLIWNINRSTKYWGDNAALFIPERWDGVSKEPHEFPTFNAGPRTCLGIHLAKLEIKYVLCKLLQRYRIVLKPDQAITYGISTTLPIQNGLFVRMEPIT